MMKLTARREGSADIAPPVLTSRRASLHHVQRNLRSRQQQRNPKVSDFFAILIVMCVLSPYLFLSWHHRLIVTEPPTTLLDPSPQYFITNKTKGTHVVQNSSEQPHQLQPSPTTNASSSQASVHHIMMPRGLDPWNATTWSIVQRDPEYKHINISLVARFFREFIVEDLVLAADRQMEQQVKTLQRAKHNLLSILRRDGNMTPITGNQSNGCLHQQNTDQGNHASNMSNATAAGANVDSLLRLQEVLGIPVCWLDPAIRSRIAPWSTIAEKYGNEPRIVGLDQCQAFQQSFPKLEDRWLAVAGLFHSGTNLLFTLLSEHCDMRPRVIYHDHASNSSPQLQFRPNRGVAEKFEGVAWQVTWGKHNPAYKRNSFTCASVPGKVIVPEITKSQQMPVVVIRHPYPWMESMCHQRYSVTFATPTGQSDCPQSFTNYPGTNQSIPVKVEYGSGLEHYESVAHMYNEWYQDYVYNATFPRLAVRMEDLIHHPRTVIQQVCECAGGIFNWNMTAIFTEIPTNETDFIPDKLPSWAMLLGSVKEGKRGHNKSQSTGFLQAWMEPKVKLVSQATRNYTRQVLDPKLMTLFHYQL